MNKIGFFTLIIGINSTVLNILFIFSLIIMFLLVINLIFGKNIKNNSSRKINPKKATKVSDINKISNIYNLTLEQKKLLINICKKKTIPNLEVNFHSENFCNNFFMTQYYDIRKNANNLSEDEIENQISVLFALRQKIENAKKQLSNLSSSIAIPEGHTLFLYNNEKEVFYAEILKNTKENIYISIPKSSLGVTIELEPLSKITFYYQTTSGTAYIFESRVVRYENQEEKNILVITHSNNLRCYQRRQYKRIDINKTCTFSAVKTTSLANGKDVNIKYEPLEKKHLGKLLEISAGGCSISTNLNIKEKQYIFIEFELDDKSKDTVVGLIVDTETTVGNSYVLHIVFVNINKKTRNKIFSKVYEYLY